MRPRPGCSSFAGGESRRLLGGFGLTGGLPSHADAGRVAVGEFDPRAFESELVCRQSFWDGFATKLKELSVWLIRLGSGCFGEVKSAAFSDGLSFERRNSETPKELLGSELSVSARLDCNRLHARRRGQQSAPRQHPACAVKGRLGIGRALCCSCKASSSTANTTSAPAEIAVSKWCAQNLITAPQFNHHSAGSLRTLTASSGPGVRSSSPGLAKTCWPIRTRSGTQCTRAEPSMNAAIGALSVMRANSPAASRTAAGLALGSQAWAALFYGRRIRARLPAARWLRFVIRFIRPPA